jgi:hypothetical protein
MGMERLMWPFKSSNGGWWIIYSSDGSYYGMGWGDYLRGASTRRDASGLRRRISPAGLDYILFVGISRQAD